MRPEVTAEGNLKDRLEYYGAANMEHQIKRIQFLTDRDCQAFWQQAAWYMEQRYGLDIVKDWTGMDECVGGSRKTRQRSIRRRKRRWSRIWRISWKPMKENFRRKKNPIAPCGDSFRVRPILNLVMPKGCCSVGKAGWIRADFWNTGSATADMGIFSDVAEESGNLVPRFFLESTCWNIFLYLRMKKRRALWIMNWSIFWRESLRTGKIWRAWWKKLMLIRFVPNYAYIQTDAAMKAEAEAMALTLCSLLAVPAITAAAAQVILLAWAYGETVMDLRSLLAGSRVPLVKTKDSWQLSLSSLLKLGTEEDLSDGKDTEGGLPYREYLRMLLFLKPQGEMALRTLGMIEQNLRKEEGLTSVSGRFMHQPGGVPLTGVS